MHGNGFDSLFLEVVILVNQRQELCVRLHAQLVPSMRVLTTPGSLTAALAEQKAGADSNDGGNHRCNCRVHPSRRLGTYVTPFRSVPTMELPDTHLETLKTLASSRSDADQTDPDVLAELRSWGLIMPGTLEPTGTRSSQRLRFRLHDT